MKKMARENRECHVQARNSTNACPFVKGTAMYDVLSSRGTCIIIPSSTSSGFKHFQTVVVSLRGFVSRERISAHISDRLTTAHWKPPYRYHPAFTCHSSCIATEQRPHVRLARCLHRALQVSLLDSPEPLWLTPAHLPCTLATPVVSL